MNDQTIQLLESLAAKLGTTSEMLWGVLVKQAPISASMDILVAFILAFLMGSTFGLSKAFREKDAEFAVTCMVAGVALTVLFTIYCSCTLGSTAAGFLNPEYWALKELLNSLPKIN